MSFSLQVENIKCAGCAGTIKKRLGELDAVAAVAVEIDTGMVSVDADEQQRDAVAALLLKLGYPETGTAEGIKAAAAKAKSFVSCAIGRLDGDS